MIGPILAAYAAACWLFELVRVIRDPEVYLRAQDLATAEQGLEEPPVPLCVTVAFVVAISPIMLPVEFLLNMEDWP